LEHLGMGRIQIGKEKDACLERITDRVGTHVNENAQTETDTCTLNSSYLLISNSNTNTTV